MKKDKIIKKALALPPKEEVKSFDPKALDALQRAMGDLLARHIIGKPPSK